MALSKEEGKGFESGLKCQKCLEPTLLKDSLPNGKNHLRRNCLECVSTDKWLCRMLRKPKQEDVETELAKEKREKAEAMKAQLAKMSPEDKAQWYTKQKEQRRKEEKTSKRTFGTAVGYVQEETSKALVGAENDHFECCEGWCQRKMTLGLYETYDEAAAAFKQECNQPGAKTMTRRGEVLLQRFAGVVVSAEDRHSLTTGLRQRADVCNTEDLRGFQAEAKDRMTKAQWRLESDKQAQLEGTLHENTGLLNIEADMEKARQIEADLEEAWMEKLEQEGIAKQSQAQSQKATVARSAGVESMGFQLAISKSVQSMLDTVSRQQATALSCQEESALLETELLREESEEHREKCESLIPKIQANIEKQKGTWEEAWVTAEESNDGTVVQEAASEVSKTLKHWQTHNQELQDLKAAIKAWKSFLNKSKAQARKADRAKTQAGAAMSSSQCGNANSWSDLPVCKQALEQLKKPDAMASLQDKGAAWNLQADFLKLPANTEAKPIVYGATQGKFAADEMKGLDYFKFQKVWVSEQMKKASGASWLSALVTKATVSKKVMTYWSKLLGFECEKKMAGFPDVLRDTYQPQFYQQVKETCTVRMCPDFGLPDVRICVEGSSVLQGFPLSSLAGECLASKRAELQRLTYQAFEGMCTWSVVLRPGKAVMVPSDHVFLELTLEEHHGGRIHLLDDEACARTQKVTKLLLADNPALANMKTGKLHEWLEDTLSKKRSAAAAAEPEATASRPAGQQQQNAPLAAKPKSTAQSKAAGAPPAKRAKIEK
eukprot:s2160_g12.t1